MLFHHSKMDDHASCNAQDYGNRKIRARNLQIINGYIMTEVPAALNNFVWRLAPDSIEQMEHVINVYRIMLDISDGDIEDMARLLAPEERQRADRFKFPKHRARFIACRAQLRLVLAGFNQLPPDSLVFTYNQFGKPSLTNACGGSSIQFNVTHSHDLGLIAVTTGMQVGIDIERIRPDIDFRHISRQFFAKGEVKSLMSLPPEQQVEAFYTCWTRKEAFLKARGEGLTIPLDHFEVSLKPDEPPRLLHSSPTIQGLADWTFSDIKPGTGYTASLAVNRRDWQFNCWQWPLRKL
jgi:4'-phosphopantetheinyl transferase